MFTSSLARCTECAAVYTSLYTAAGDLLCSMCPDCESAANDYFGALAVEIEMDFFRGI